MKSSSLFKVFLFLCFSISIAQSNPETIDDSYNTGVDITLSVEAPQGLLSNDSDPDNDSLSVDGFIVNGIFYDVGQTASTLGGSISINDDGSFLYDPAPGFTNNEPVIAYKVTDGSLSSFGHLFITITSSNAPAADDDFDTVNINTTLNLPAPGVLSNDTFEDENTIEIITFTVGGTTYNVGETANTTAGSFTLQADGSYVFIPSNGYTGAVPAINYTISDGINTSTATLFLTVQEVDNLLLLDGITSCNQGYTTSGNYRIQFSLGFRNASTATDFNPESIISNIELTKDLDEIYGAGCVIAVEDLTINSPPVVDFLGNPYPIDFDISTVNQDFINGTSSNIFTENSVQNSVLYPRQQVFIRFCLVVEPFCNGRPNPTPSGSGIDFEPIVSITSSAGDGEGNLLLEDFHTTEALVTAGFFIPDNTPEVNPDGTFDYINTIVLTNEGGNIANNVNYNMGLGDFLDNGLSFSILTVTQVSGPPVNVNTNYDGDTNSQLLLPNNSLAPGESVVLEIFHLLEPVSFTGINNFFQVNPSQTQGALDGFDETLPENSRLFSFAIWEDGLGNHLDIYYPIAALEETPVNDQCSCASRSMSFIYVAVPTSEKEITNIETAPNGILEYEELTFQLTVTNSSTVVELDNLVLQDDLSLICGINPISFTAPEIVSSTATIDPNLNPDYDGINDIDIFDGSSGLLNEGESVTVELTVLYSEECVGQNTILFSGTDPAGEITTSISTVDVDTSNDNDEDGISNANDIDDDNDTIPDIIEYDGLDPLDDHDGDFVPNYRDSDFSPDANNDGIVDIFDFDGDGVPNHFDLDSDGDGIFDIDEAGNLAEDTDSDGLTNNPVGLNGLDDTVETDDSFTASITYSIPNTDNNTNPDYLDIDADDDGIVDNIEAQPTNNYTPPNGTVDDRGLDTAYLQGLDPIDTDEDEIFDYVDINSDNDSRDDFIEGWDFDSDGTPETVASGVDIDNDGLDDAFDNNTTLVNPTNSQVPEDFPNVDYDVTPERDWREIMAVVVIISDTTTTEGNDMVFTISLVRYIDNETPVQSASPIELVLFTSDGSETSGEFNVALSLLDYESVSDENLIIPPFTENVTFSVATLDDNISEQNEEFTLNAGITSANTVNIEAKGIGIIIDDEPLPTITMNDDIVNEGEELIYNINIDIPSSTPIEINITTLDNTATSPTDYIAIDIRIIIQSTADPENPNLGNSFSITTLEDNINELNEEVLFVLGDVVTNNVTNPDFNNTGTILDTDPNPVVTISNDEVVEGNTLVFTLQLIGADGLPTITYLPVDFELETLDVTTTVNLDYDYFYEFNFIPAGQSSLTIEIPTNNDNLNEDEEYMNLSATIVSGEVANSSNVLLGLGTIKDNDIPNLFSPNDDGQSDVFRIGDLQDFPNFKLIIFDRWGSEIYNYDNNGRISPQWWDGTKNGSPVIEGVYFYELDYNDGFTKPKTGFIQLIR